MDPVISKAGARPISPRQDAGQPSPKSQPSKFDKVRVNLQNQVTPQLPPPAAANAAEQKRVLESQLRQRMQQARTPADMFRTDLNGARRTLDGLHARVDALPKTPAFEPLRARLQGIETQFNATGKLLDGLSHTNDPRELLKVQMQVFEITQNLEIISRVVEQVNTGVKSVLQTQV
jgi:hypothetical protein